MLSKFKAPEKPTKELMAITIRDVPMAFLIGILKKTFKAGTIRKPPPAPTNPVKVPTRLPFFITSSIEGESVLVLGFVRPLIILMPARSITEAKERSIKRSLVRVSPEREKISSGIKGMPNLLTSKTESIEGAANKSPVLMSTLSFLYCLKNPTKEAALTTKREYEVASIGA